jgi:hypothetical protein
MRSQLAIALIGVAMSATPVLAQQAKIHRVGLLANSIPAADLARGTSEVQAPKIIVAGLRELGWVDGKNIRLI